MKQNSLSENIKANLLVLLFTSMAVAVLVAVVFGIKHLDIYIKNGSNDNKVYHFIISRKYICETSTNRYKVSTETNWEFNIINDEYYFKKDELLVLVRDCKEIEKLK